MAILQWRLRNVIGERIAVPSSTAVLVGKRTAVAVAIDCCLGIVVGARMAFPQCLCRNGYMGPHDGKDNNDMNASRRQFDRDHF